jgi:hypothetical protein
MPATVMSFKLEPSRSTYDRLEAVALPEVVAEFPERVFIALRASMQTLHLS